jgi:RNase P protein component
MNIPAVSRQSVHATPFGAIAQRTSLVEWIKAQFQLEFEAKRVFAGTFLFVEGIKREAATKAYAHFFHTLERSIYGKALERHLFKPSLKHLAILEGGGATGKPCHYHSIFAKPLDRNYTDEAFMTLIDSKWKSLRVAMKNEDVASRIERVYDLEGWIAYQFKPISKETGNGVSYYDMLDIPTLRI